MSETVPDPRPASRSSTPGSPPPAAYGASGTPVTPEAQSPRLAPPGAADAGTFYGPVHRYARPPAALDPGAPVSTAAVAGPAGPPWPPDAPPGPAPLAWGPAAPPAVGWGPPPPSWGPAGPWSPPRRHDYASWGRRVAGAAIDAAPGWVATAVLYAGYVPLYVGLFRGDFDVRPSYGLVLVGTLLSLAAFGWAIYNVYFLAGRTGQSVGKRIMKTWLVSQQTGRPIGPFNAFLRSLLHVLDGLGYVGYLWPLWDDERQTLADKLAQTVVVRTPVPPLTELERHRP